LALHRSRQRLFELPLRLLKSYLPELQQTLYFITFLDFCQCLRKKLKHRHFYIKITSYIRGYFLGRDDGTISLLAALRPIGLPPSCPPPTKSRSRSPQTGKILSPDPLYVRVLQQSMKPKKYPHQWIFFALRGTIPPRRDDLLRDPKRFRFT